MVGKNSESLVPGRKPMFGWLVEELMLTNLPICEAQELLQPECTVVHEDCKSLKQRSRWVSFRSNTNYLPNVVTMTALMV